MDYVLFGIQGSGKGTQGKILAQRINAPYFETGGELRRLAKENSPEGAPPWRGINYLGRPCLGTASDLNLTSRRLGLLGQKVKSIIEAGNLVPNEVVMEIVENFIKNKTAACAAVFDGLPRNKHQNDTFEALLQKLGRDYTGLYFELSREEAQRRLLTRRICSKCKEVYPAAYENTACEKCKGKLVARADDNADSIRTRIEIFYNETLPVIEDWKTRGKMITVNGAPPIEEVTKEMFSAIKP